MSILSNVIKNTFEESGLDCNIKEIKFVCDLLEKNISKEVTDNFQEFYIEQVNKQNSEV